MATKRKTRKQQPTRDLAPKNTRDVKGGSSTQLATPLIPGGAVLSAAVSGETTKKSS